jgi:hypothetical protein
VPILLSGKSMDKQQVGGIDVRDEKSAWRCQYRVHASATEMAMKGIWRGLISRSNIREPSAANAMILAGEHPSDFTMGVIDAYISTGLSTVQAYCHSPRDHKAV